MQYYVVTYTHTKLVRWAIYLYAHIKYLKKLVKQGKLQISGPGVGTPVRSAQLVFNVTDEKVVNQLIADDPYSIHDLVASKTVHLWNVTHGSMTKPAASDPEGTKYYRATYELKDQALLNQYQKEHDAYLDQLLKEKKIRAAGSYVEDQLSGLLIISAADATQAETIMRKDPYIQHGHAKYKIIEWDPKFGEFK